MTKYGVFSDPYFPVFGLNTEIYSIYLRIQSKYRKIRTRKTSVCGQFSRSDLLFNLICKVFLFVLCNFEFRIVFANTANYYWHKYSLPAKNICLINTLLCEHCIYCEWISWIKYNNIAFAWNKDSENKE